MIATIVFSNIAHEDDPSCAQSPRPSVYEFNNVQNLCSKIIDLQYFLYRPDYILVEFCGKIYDATTPDTKESKELMRKIDDIINFKIDDLLK